MVKKTLPILLSALILAGCATEPPADLFVSTPQMLEQRQLESRRYDNLNEEEILAASAAVLQDMGYTLKESETELGVITGSKERDATNAGEVALAVVGALFGAYIPTSDTQTIIASLVVKPIFDENGKPILKSHHVRVTFQQIVYLTSGDRRAEVLKDPELFIGFHEKLSKSVFIEGQKL